MACRQTALSLLRPLATRRYSTLPGVASSSTSAHPSVPELIPTDFRSLRTSLNARSLAISEREGILTLTDKQRIAIQTKEAEAGMVNEGKGTMYKVKVKKIRKRKGIQLKEDKDAGVAGKKEKKEEAAHPGVEALRAMRGIKGLTFEVEADSLESLAANSIKQHIETFFYEHLPALIWSNPSVHFATTFGCPANALNFTFVDETKAPARVRLDNTPTSTILFLCLGIKTNTLQLPEPIPESLLLTWQAGSSSKPKLGKLGRRYWTVWRRRWKQGKVQQTP